MKFLLICDDRELINKGSMREVRTFLEAVASLGLVVSLSQSVTESRFSDIRKKGLLLGPEHHVGHQKVTCFVTLATWWRREILNN